MSGLFGSLTQTVRALNAHSRGVETAGRNVANMNNAEYSRQRVVFADRGTVLTPQGAQSLGIEAKAIQQVRDSLLDEQVVRERGLTSSLEAQQSAQLQAQATLGESIDRSAGVDDVSASANGIAAAMADFFNATQGVAARPTDPGERQNLVQRAEILTERFNFTESRLTQLQTDLDVQINTEVAEISALLDSIAELNGQIGRFEINAAGSAVDLRDQRQARVEELAGYLAIETQPSAVEDGQLDVFVRDAADNPIMLVELTGVSNAVSFDGNQLVAGSASTPIALSGGSVHGVLRARDGAVQDLRDGIARLAEQLATSVNAAYNPTGATGDFFAFNPADPASTLQLASGLTHTNLKTSDGGSAADTTLIRAVADVADASFSVAGGDSIDGTLVQYYAGIVSDLGRAVAGTQGRLEDQSNIEALVTQQRLGVSGVSLDEEMADLMKYQRAFEASSRVVSIIDGLLDIVVNRLGRG